MKNFSDLLTEEVHSKIWKDADDVIERTQYLGEIYEDVPEGLKEISVKVMEIHMFPEEDRERVKNYLNNVPNSARFIKED
ncbi:hypothetical protein N9948_00670 [bacterium]|nr:hypothetical protein [bacterium]